MKKLFVSLAIVLGLLLVAIVVLPIIFKDDIVELVKKQANENLNAKVNFNNDISLSLIKNFPNFTIGVKDMSIVGIGDFEGDTLVSWKNFEATVDIMSVIKGEQITVRKVMLDDPRIHVLVLSNGKASWDIAKPSADTTTADPADTSATAFDLKLKKLEINNAYIVYDDKAMGMFSKLDGFDYDMSGDFTQDEFVLNIVSTIKALDVSYGGVHYLNKVNTELKADLNMNMPQMKFAFKENSIRLNALKFNFDGFVEMPGDDIKMDLKYSADKASFKDILSLVPGVYTKEFDNVKTAGTLAFNGFAKGVYNEKQLPAFAFNLDVNNAMFQYPSLPVPVKDIVVKLAITNPDGNLNNTLVDLSKFHMDVAGDAFDARMVAKNVMQDPNIDAWLKGRVNLGNVTKIVPLEGMEVKGMITADVTAKGAVSTLEQQNYEAFNAAGQIVAQDIFFKSADLPQGFSLAIAELLFTPKIVTLKSFDANIGKSDMKMNGEVSNFFPYLFSKGTLNGKLNFSSDLIDANQFITSEEAPVTETVPDTASIAAPEIPSNINFVLNSSIGKLLYTNMEITNFAGGITIAGQKLSFNNIGLNTLGAAIKMDGYYETTNPVKPTVAMDFGISNLDIQKAVTTFNTIKKLAPIAESMKGSFSTTLNMTTQLDQHLNPVYPTLFANGTLTIPNAEISDVKVFNKVADALKNDKYRKLAINNVKIDYKVEGGRIYTQPFDVNVAGQKMNLSGSTGLDQTIDYKGLVTIPRKDLGAVNSAMESALKSLNTKAGTSINMNENIDVALGLTGTFSDPKITTNLADIAKKQASSLKDQAKDELNKKKKELEEKAKAEAERIKKEAEAKAKAEADKVKQKAKEEADRIKKEAEDKIKAEQEKAKQKAEEEAKKKLKGIFKK